MINRTLQPQLTSPGHCLVEFCSLDVGVRIIWFISAREMRHQSGDLDVLSIAQESKNLIPLGAVHTIAVHARFDLDHYFDGNFDVDQDARVSKRWHADDNIRTQCIREVLFWFPHPRHNRCLDTQRTTSEEHKSEL